MPDRIKAGIILPVIRKETLMRQKCFMGVFSNLYFFGCGASGKHHMGVPGCGGREQISPAARPCLSRGKAPCTGRGS